MKKSLKSRIDDLREEGYETEIEHIRNVLLTDIHNLFPKGGRTVAKIKNNNGNIVCQGEARCSDKDNYCKRLGANIALGRAESILAKKNRI